LRWLTEHDDVDYVSEAPTVVSSSAKDKSPLKDPWYC